MKEWPWLLLAVIAGTLIAYVIWRADMARMDAEIDAQHERLERMLKR